MGRVIHTIVNSIVAPGIGDHATIEQIVPTAAAFETHPSIAEPHGDGRHTIFRLSQPGLYRFAGLIGHGGAGEQVECVDALPDQTDDDRRALVDFFQASASGGADGYVWLGTDGEAYLVTTTDAMRWIEQERTELFHSNNDNTGLGALLIGLSAKEMSS